MKKLMLTMVTIAVAIMSQAASVDWSITYAGQGATWSGNGATVIAFSGSDYDYIVKLVTVTGSSTLKSDLTAKSLGDSTFTNFRGSARNSTVKSANAPSSMFWMIFTEGSYDAGKAVTWTSAIDVSTYKYEPPATGTTFAMTADNFVNNGTIAKTSSIPEPTSAMLLVLGMAGLMLKRKRA